MIWGAATVKIALGGLGGDELTEFSRLAGQYRESLTTSQFGTHGATLQTTLQDRPVISPEHIRTLSEQEREALVLHATTPPVITRMVRHYEGPHAAEHAASVMETRAALIPGLASAIVPDGPGPSGTSTPGDRK